MLSVLQKMVFFLTHLSEINSVEWKIIQINELVWDESLLDCMKQQNRKEKQNKTKT